MRGLLTLLGMLRRIGAQDNLDDEKGDEKKNEDECPEIGDSSQLIYFFFFPDCCTL